MIPFQLDYMCGSFCNPYFLALLNSLKCCWFLSKTKTHTCPGIIEKFFMLFTVYRPMSNY